MSVNEDLDYKEAGKRLAVIADELFAHRPAQIEVSLPRLDTDPEWFKHSVKRRPHDEHEKSTLRYVVDVVVTLSGGTAYRTPYHYGVQVRGSTWGEWRPVAGKGKAPSNVDVLAALMNDATCVDGMTFEEWCDNFGTDPDSIKGLRAYQQCQQCLVIMRRLLGKRFDEAAELTRQL